MLKNRPEKRDAVEHSPFPDGGRVGVTWESPKERWNRIYAQGRRTPLRETLQRFIPLARVGRALEIACGTGENAVFLARLGFRVDAFDISEVAVRQARERARQAGVQVNFLVYDAATFPFPSERYDLVVNFYFLERRTFPGIRRALKPGGLLIFETFNVRHRAVRPDAPAEHFLRFCELTRAFAEGFQALHYEERGSRTVLVARKLENP